MEEQKMTLQLDNSITKTFIKAIDLYKLASGFLDYGEDIEECQNIKEQIMNNLSLNTEKQKISLVIKKYHIFIILNAVEFFNLTSALLGYQLETMNCQIIKNEVICNML